MAPKSTIYCPACNKPWQASIDLSIVGIEVLCPHCHTQLIINAPGGFEVKEQA